jgi:hypothetical protein
MGLIKLLFRKVVPVVSIIAALSSTLPRTAQAQYLDYLKDNDPQNIILLAQKHTEDQKRQYAIAQEQLSMKETRFLDFEFSRWERISDSINISSSKSYEEADTLIRNVAREIQRIGDTLDVKFDLQGMLRLKIRRADKDIERLITQQKWGLAIRRYFGLYSLSHHLGFGGQQRKYHRLWQERCSAVR